MVTVAHGQQRCEAGAIDGAAVGIGTERAGEAVGGWYGGEKEQEKGDVSTVPQGGGPGKGCASRADVARHARCKLAAGPTVD